MMASIWRCRSRVRLRHISSNEPSISLFRHTFSSFFPQYQRIESSRQAPQHALIWRKRSRLLLEEQSKAHPTKGKRASGESRLDLKVLKAAIWHDMDQNATGTLFADKEQTDRVLRRMADLYDEMASIGIPIDNRWCQIMITTFRNILTQRSENQEGITYTEMLRFLRLARKMFLQVSSELTRPTFTNTTLIYGILDLEMQVAMALIRESNENTDIDRNLINEHLHWVTDMANMMATRREMTSEQGLSSDQEAYQQDLISLSSTEAGTTTINLYILRGDHSRAIEALRHLLKHATNIPKSTNLEGDPKKRHFRRIGQNYIIARGALINLLVVLCRDVRKGGGHLRSLIKEVIILAHESVKDGLWDIMRDDHQSQTELCSRDCKGPSYDFARLCVRAISAVSPATTRRRRAVDGVKYEMIHGDEKQHYEDFFDLLKTIIDIRSSTVARELSQTLRQSTSDGPLAPLEPIAQPWRRSFRSLFDVNREMSARIVWCLFSPWSRKQMRISSIDQKYDEEARICADEETDLFLKRFAFILDNYMISFGMSEPSWQATAIGLQKTLHLLPSQKGREEAKVMFGEAYEKAKKNNFGAIPPPTK